MSVSPITIIGFGISGQLLLCQLLEFVKGSQISVIDSDFSGGDLMCKYSAIQSNTTIGQKVERLTQEGAIDDWQEIGLWLSKRGKSTDCLPVVDIATDVQRKGHERVKECTAIYDSVLNLEWDETTKLWTIQFSSTRPSMQTRILCICTGMEPRQDDYGVPSIPLSIGLDPPLLKRMVLPGQKVLVVGLSHSGTLAIKHLLSINDVDITGIYRSDTPFKYDRNGYYGGIKKESADIADAILQGDYGNRLTLLSIKDTLKISQKVHSANWIIQSIGFQSRSIRIHSQKPLWDSKTGECIGYPQILSFGACNPATTEYLNRHYDDISICSFLDQIEARLHLLKQQLKDASIIT